MKERTTMSRFQIAVICMLGVMICAQSAALIVLMNRQEAPPARKVSAAPARPAASPPVARNTLSAPSPRAPAGFPGVGVYAPRPVDPARLQALQKKFEALSTQKTPDPDEVDALLGELVDIQGTSVIAGVDLNVLRQNLRLARDLQRITEEMDAEYRKPVSDTAKMESLRQKAVALQNQLAASFQGRPAASPSVTKPPVPSARPEAGH
jgi:hypothetical protein